VRVAEVGGTAEGEGTPQKDAVVNEAAMTVTRFIGQGLVFLVLWSLATVAVDASHTNERADPSVWIAPAENVPGYVYQNDPCVEALRGAMEAMEPFLPQRLQGSYPLWESLEFYSPDGKAQLEEARRTWEEAKLQCWRH